MTWNRAICIASGPSLNRADVDRSRQSGWPLIAVNCTWKAIPDCDVIYAGDWAWWNEFHNLVPSHPALWTCSRKATQDFGINYFPRGGAFNSGQRAVQFAIWQGAKTVLLLGYDCSIEQGSHWHGDHTALRNPDVSSAAKWQRHFAVLAEEAQRAGVKVVNCSARTAISDFQRQSLRTALEEYQ
ncbi:hypothetical protein [Enterobacter kobei]|uniref:hypothetical protein n=1 Tax=Enterobacter kobei TaxID=208224 RepID=UPI003CF5100F